MNLYFTTTAPGEPIPNSTQQTTDVPELGTYLLRGGLSTSTPAGISTTYAFDPTYLQTVSNHYWHSAGFISAGLRDQTLRGDFTTDVIAQYRTEFAPLVAASVTLKAALFRWTKADGLGGQIGTTQETLLTDVYTNYTLTFGTDSAVSFGTCDRLYLELWLYLIDSPSETNQLIIGSFRFAGVANQSRISVPQVLFSENRSSSPSHVSTPTHTGIPTRVSTPDVFKC